MPALRVYLVRHARAEGSAATDAARRLTPEGRAAFEALARRLAPRLDDVTRIRTSPFERAVETADLLALALGGRAGPVTSAVEEDPALAAGVSGGTRILALAARAGDGAALVGHNPELAEAVALAAGREVEVKPGTIAALDLEGGRASLVWMEAP